MNIGEVFPKLGKWVRNAGGKPPNDLSSEVFRFGLVAFPAP